MRASDSFSLVRSEVLALRERLIDVRRDLHQHPELSWEETRTQRALLQHLRRLGLDDVRPVARTGATGLVRGAAETPCILWRADIDALPIPERSGLPFSSKNEGVMHACGHDAHAAIALGIAEALARGSARLPGSVRFVFQPAEEDTGGAEACIADGVLEKPPVDRVLGLHISADVPLGAVNVAPGPFFASPTHFKILITGRGGHAAAPHQAVDAIVVGANVVTALQTVVSRSVGPAEAAVVTIGEFHAGFRWNVIAESATLTGTVRSYTPAVRQLILSRIEELVAGITAGFGATYSFEWAMSCPPLVNDPGVTALVIEKARCFFGADRVHGAASMGGDDMAVFLEKRPGCYFWLGARNEPRGIAGRHHDAGFAIDEDALLLGVEFGLRLIEASLDELASAR
jgi:amidohydrolase